jgi:hypothetical protein
MLILRRIFMAQIPAAWSTPPQRAVARRTTEWPRAAFYTQLVAAYRNNNNRRTTIFQHELGNAGASPRLRKWTDRPSATATAKTVK